MGPILPSRLRGTNYLPMPGLSDNLHLAWLPPNGQVVRPTVGVDGYFSLRHLRNDLDRMRYSGINNIRLWGSLVSWLANQAAYTQILTAIAAECAARNMTVTYVMWNAIPAGFAATGSLIDSKDAIASAGTAGSAMLAFWALTAGWLAHANYPVGVPAGDGDLTHIMEPLKTSAWTTQGYYADWSDAFLKASVASYITAMANFWHGPGRPAFQSYDLYNEPDAIFNGTVDPYIKNFIVETYNRIAAVHPDPECTVGWAGDSATLSPAIMVAPPADVSRPLSGVPLHYFSLHNYDGAGPFLTAVLATSAAAARYGKQVVVSEFYDAGQQGGLLSGYLSTIFFSNAGGQIWSYIGDNAYRSGGVLLGGVVLPDQVAASVRFDSDLSYRTVNIFDDIAFRNWTGV